MLNYWANRKLNHKLNHKPNHGQKSGVKAAAAGLVFGLGGAVARGARGGMLPSGAACVMVAGLAAVTTTSTVHAQGDAVQRANDLYRTIAPNLRSDTVLLPLVAKMQPVPGAFANIGEAMLLGAETRGFAAAKSWAEGAPQKAVLDALKRVTSEGDHRKAFAFGLAYGAENVPAEWVASGTYVELGDPATLAAAQLLYLPKLDAMESLVQVEATRRAAMDDPNGAIDVLLDLAFFGRQMADRQMFEEAMWGMRVMQRSFERIRDVAYIDMVSAERKLNLDKLLTQVARMDGYLDLDRMKLPEANRISTEQVLARVYDDRGAIRPEAFAGTMATLGLQGRPLRIFSEAARWQSAAASQADGVNARRILSGLYADWARRWAMNPFDDSLNTTSAFAGLDRTKEQAIAMSTPNLWHLAEWRRVNTLERVGTRATLSLLGVLYTNNVFAPTITSIRPRWMTQLDSDPFNPNIEFGNRPPLEYFVPQRNRAGRIDTEAKPHEMTVVTNTKDRPSVTFKVDLKSDVFVLYSVGTDLARNNAARVQNTAERVQGADYLIFPSTLSLYRQFLIDGGELQ